MYLDTSRNRFDPAKHYSAVVLQQGRVILDSDMAEQNAITANYLRTAMTDLIGPAGCPKNDAGFEILPTVTNDQADLTIGPGRIYVDGILVENAYRATTYLAQPEGYVDAKLDALPTQEGFIAYLRVWERSVNSLQDPDIREVALGIHGPDTTGRAQVVWQVAFSAVSGNPAAANAVKNWRSEIGQAYHPQGLLQARARTPQDAVLDVCSVSPTARYRGRENQHYRVEILRSGTASTPGTEPVTGGVDTADPETAVATFVWSRENGSVVFGIDALAGPEVTLASLGRDLPSGLEVQDWVEVVDDASCGQVVDEVPTGPGRVLFQVIAIDPLNCIVTLDRDPGDEIGGIGSDLTRHPLLRRWDGAGSAAVEVDEWLELECGVQVRFSGPDAGAGEFFRSGDFWSVPARTVLGDVIWPQDATGPMALPPAGIDYHYAALAYIHADRSKPVDDLRLLFAPLAK